MKKQSWKAYVFWILLAEAVGALSGWVTAAGREAYAATAKLSPALSPPDILFPIVWTVLYALMGVGAARIYLAPASKMRSRSLAIFLLQLGVNFFWSVFFFSFQAFGLAFFWLLFLWVLIIVMMVSFYRVDRVAAWLQLPYLLWVTFAGYLNAAVWAVNLS